MDNDAMHLYHISGKSVFIPSQLYTLRMASQNFPQDGIPTAPPVRIIIKVELHFALQFFNDNILQFFL